MNTSNTFNEKFCSICNKEGHLYHECKERSVAISKWLKEKKDFNREKVISLVTNCETLPHNATTLNGDSKFKSDEGVGIDSPANLNRQDEDTSAISDNFIEEIIDYVEWYNPDSDWCREDVKIAIQKSMNFIF